MKFLNELSPMFLLKPVIKQAHLGVIVFKDMVWKEPLFWKECLPGRKSVTVDRKGIFHLGNQPGDEPNYQAVLEAAGDSLAGMSA